MQQAITSLPRAHQACVLLHTDLQGAQTALFATLGLLQVVEGGVLLQVEADDLDWLARELARLPFSFQIESPPTLREALARHAQALLRVCQLSPDPDP